MRAEHLVTIIIVVVYRVQKDKVDKLSGGGKEDSPICLDDSDEEDGKKPGVA